MSDPTVEEWNAGTVVRKPIARAVSEDEWNAGSVVQQTASAESEVEPALAPARTRRPTVTIISDAPETQEAVQPQILEPVTNNIETTIQQGYNNAQYNPQQFSSEDEAELARLYHATDVSPAEVLRWTQERGFNSDPAYGPSYIRALQAYRDQVAAHPETTVNSVSYGRGRDYAVELLGSQQVSNEDIEDAGSLSSSLGEGFATSLNNIIVEPLFDALDSDVQGIGKDEIRQAYPHLSEEEVETVHEDLIGQGMRRMRDEATSLANLADPNPVTRVVGNALGGFSLVDAIPIAGAETFAGRMALGAGANALTDVASQGVDNAYGAREGYDPSQTFMEGVTGSVVQGGLEGLGRIARSVIPSKPATPRPTPEAAALETDVVTRMTEVMRGARRQSRVNAESLAEFRSNQARALAEARNRPGLEGEKRLNAELAALEGSADREALDIRGQFTESDINELFSRIDTSPAFRRSVFGSLNAKVGLRKILEGEVPTPSEMRRLSQVFPPDFIKSALGMRGNRQILDNIGNVANLPRAMMATADFSAPLRQGIVFAGRKEFYTALPTMFREFREGFLRNDRVPVAERGQNWQSSGSTVLDEIRSRRSYDDMEESGLAVTNPYDHAIAGREEDFMSNLAERIPGFGRLARGSNAAYAGFLNKLRADVFDTLTAGQNLSKEDMAGVSRFINSATGRGDLGSLNRAAPILNAAFFSPRLIKARVDMLNPVFYARLPPVARSAAMADMLKFGGLVTTVLTLASLGGAEVETDPRSSDFLKVKTGNTRLDVAGGFPQYVTLAARLATGETKSLKGNVRPLDGRGINDSRSDVLIRFGRNKLSPTVGYGWTAMDGVNPVGEPYDPVETTARMVIPLYLQGLEDVMQDETTSTKVKTAIAIASLFGVGSQSFDANAPRNGSETPSETEFNQRQVVAPPSDEEFNNGETADVPPTAAEFDAAPVFSTEANLKAVDILSGMGLTLTDSGIRSREEQAEYYTSTSGVSRPGTSPHEVGNAVDIRVPTGVSPDEIVAQFKAEGYEGVTIITKQHGTGPHWHIQWESAPQ